MDATQQMARHRFHGPGPAQEGLAPVHSNPNDEYPVAEVLADRLRHAIVFAEATLRTLREALEIIEKEAPGGKPHDHHA
jgi:hypothetical protein